MPVSFSNPRSPSLSAPHTVVVTPLECQSKPNHITMTGAIPMMGSALTRLPIGSSPRRRKGTRSARIATAKPERQPTV